MMDLRLRTLASKSDLGSVIVGDGIDVAADGTIYNDYARHSAGLQRELHLD